MSKKIVEAIINKEYDVAKAQENPGNSVTSVDKPGSPPETDGDTIGAGEGIPSDFEGKGTPETTGRGAAPIAAGDDPGSTELDDGGVGEQEADYGPAVVTEEDDEDEKDGKDMKDDDGDEKEVNEGDEEDDDDDDEDDKGKKKVSETDDPEDDDDEDTDFLYRGNAWKGDRDHPDGEDDD